MWVSGGVEDMNSTADYRDKLNQSLQAMTLKVQEAESGETLSQLTHTRTHTYKIPSS